MGRAKPLGLGPDLGSFEFFRKKIRRGFKRGDQCALL